MLAVYTGVGAAAFGQIFITNHPFTATNQNSIHIASGGQFDYVISNFGISAAITLAAIIVFFVFFLIKASKKNRDPFYHILSLTAVLMIAFQFLFSLVVIGNFGLASIIGTQQLSMPFVTSDSTGFVMNMIFLGIVLSAWRRKDITPAIPPILQKAE